VPQRDILLSELLVRLVAVDVRSGSASLLCATTTTRHLDNHFNCAGMFDHEEVPDLT
jgi:hypothetical protein